MYVSMDLVGENTLRWVIQTGVVAVGLFILFGFLSITLSSMLPLLLASVLVSVTGAYFIFVNVENMIEKQG